MKSNQQNGPAKPPTASVLPLALRTPDSRLAIHWRRGRCWLWLVLLLGLARCSQAQWQTQSILIKPGWTAVYLFVDASYANLDYLVGRDPNNPIGEVWLWQAP